MSTEEVFKEILKVRGIQEIRSVGLIRAYLYFANYFAYQPYRWDKKQKELTNIKGATAGKAFRARLSMWVRMLVNATAILLALSPMALLKEDEYGKNFIHILVAGIFSSVSLMIIFHGKTCSEFCQFVNSMMKFTDNVSKHFISRGKSSLDNNCCSK